MRLTREQIQALERLCQDEKKFPHELQSFIPLNEGIRALLEMGMIQVVAGGYILTEKGKDICTWMKLL
jgi:hypothetical protein